MANDLHTEKAPVTNLVTGIISDAQDLLGQQLSMFQLEFREEYKKAKEAAIPLVGGLAVGVTALVLIGITVAHVIQWQWPELPLWVGFAIAAGIFAAGGVGLFLVGKKQFDAVHPLPENSVEALKENVQWITKN